MIDQLGEPYKTFMPDAVCECFVPLMREVTWLSEVWRELRTFSRDEAPLKLVNATAPGFFNMVGTTLWDYVILGICRLADPPGTQNRPNMTLPRLFTVLDDPKLRSGVEQIFAFCTADIAKMSGHRNQRIAHNDMTTILGAPLRPLEEVDAEQVERVLQRFIVIIHWVERHYTHGRTIFQIREGARQLLSVLEAAAEAGIIEP